VPGTVFGLPTHALIVHAAVIIVPLAVIALAATGWNANWRRHYSFPVALMAIGGAIFAFIAAQSGGPLERQVRRAAEVAGVQRVRFGGHPGNGNTAEFVAIVFAAFVVVYWGVNRYGERWKLPAWMPFGSYVVALVPGILALTTMIIAGHSGAKLVWKDVGSFAPAK
jgi:hypothetical protein